MKMILQERLFDRVHKFELLLNFTDSNLLRKMQLESIYFSIFAIITFKSRIKDFLLTQTVSRQYVKDNDSYRYETCIVNDIRDWTSNFSLISK